MIILWVLWVFAVTYSVIIACITYKNRWMIETVMVIVMGILWGVLLWP